MGGSVMLDGIRLRGNPLGLRAVASGNPLDAYTRGVGDRAVIEWTSYGNAYRYFSSIGAGNCSFIVHRVRFNFIVDWAEAHDSWREQLVRTVTEGLAQ